MKLSDKRPAGGRAADVRPFYVMDVLARARQMELEGRPVLHLEVGEPDFPTPQPIIDAGITALRRLKTHYTPAMGIAPLRAAIAGHYLSRYNVEINPGRVIVSPGSSGALQLVMSVVINPGQKVMMADPSYPCNRNFVYLVGGDICAIPVDHNSDYQLTAEMVKAQARLQEVGVREATERIKADAQITQKQMELLQKAQQFNAEQQFKYTELEVENGVDVAGQGLPASSNQ